MPPFARGPWSGPEKLVIGIDIGTTQTAVSYIHLYPGGPQVVTRVSSWPGQPIHRASSKIPSVISYDQKENPRYCGAEAMSEDAKDEAKEDGWRLARHFKLHLHPAELRTSHNIATEEPPLGLTVETIYSDFLHYLLKSTKTFFVARTPNGATVWQQLIDDAEFVIAHPNAWGIREQRVLRRAAVRADYVSPTQADARVRFVSEGEASVHFCIVHGNLDAKLKAGTRLLVCDAGGSTVDTTAYTVKAFRPNLQLEEFKASGCVQAGGIFVNQEALRQLRRLFSDAQIPEDEMERWLHIFEEDFERSLKRGFPRPAGRHAATVDKESYNNHALGIKNGRLLLSTETVASFFGPCVSRIKTAVKGQLSGFAAEHILLVGGFGGSRYLQQQLAKTFGSPTRDLALIEDGTSNAVADGAVIWNCLRTVKARAARFSFGVNTRVIYDPAALSHRGREQIGSDRVVRGAWSQLLAKGTSVRRDLSKSYHCVYQSASDAERDLSFFRCKLFSHRGIPESGAFIRNTKGGLNPGFKHVCTVAADMRQVTKTLKTQRGSTFLIANYHIGLTFGGTELKAFIQWEENGVKKRGPTTIIPDALV